MSPFFPINVSFTRTRLKTAKDLASVYCIRRVYDWFASMWGRGI